MGLIKAALQSASSVLGDQWKEYFYCDSMDADVLVSKGKKRSSNRSSNKGSDNIITNGSVIAVNEGQCMMIVDQGAIVEFTAEPGEFTWDASSEPSIFTGELGSGIVSSWEHMKRRFTFGGDTAKDQRVYFFNLKEIMSNRFGTATPIPFRIVDCNVGLDYEASLRCNGEYSYKITDPMLFYKNVCGNVTTDYTRSNLDSMLKSEFLSALQPVFAAISAKGIRYSQLPAETEVITQTMNAQLSGKWSKLRGISVVSVGINSATISPEDEKTLKELQKTAVYRSMDMAMAGTVSAQNDAMRAAASNPNGAMNAFMGMNMAQQAGAGNLAAMLQMSQNQQQSAPAGNRWTCSCGAENTGKFCTQCGKPHENGWTCACGNVNKGKFCSNCGAKKPAGEPLYRCDKCGWEPADPKHPPKFCPECGDPFDDKDIQ